MTEVVSNLVNLNSSGLLAMMPPQPIKRASFPCSSNSELQLPKHPVSFNPANHCNLHHPPPATRHPKNQGAIGAAQKHEEDPTCVSTDGSRLPPGHAGAGIASFRPSWEIARREGTAGGGRRSLRYTYGGRLRSHLSTATSRLREDRKSVV